MRLILEEYRLKCHASCNIIRVINMCFRECHEEATTDQQEKKRRRTREASGNGKATMR